MTDGDTIHVLKDNQRELKIRLTGIDSPELARGNQPGQSIAQEALDFMNKLVLNKRVRVQSYGLDRSRSILVFVFLNGMNVNLEIVKAGLAEIYRGKGKVIKEYREELKKAESEARSIKRAMWIQGDKYESPAKFRARTGVREG